MKEFIWFVTGFVVGIPVVTTFIATYGDHELNAQIRAIRKGRFDLQMLKLKYEAKHIAYKVIRLNTVVLPKGGLQVGDKLRVSYRGVQVIRKGVVVK